MKKFLVIILLPVFTACGPKIYKSATFDSSKEAIKTLAILPFDVSIDTKRLPKGTTIETLKESQEKTGYDIQSHAYSWLLHRQNDYTVTFQDADRTNALLKKANINYDDIALQDKADLCKILGVDGIISGKAMLSRPMSEGAAIATELLIGAWGSTNKATTTLTIHDTSGNLLWKYDYEANGSLGSTADKLTDNLMRNASKKFPYKNSN
ncbi:MAG: hypothetical protein ABI405_00475 [Parafilimonas sp.]